MASTHFSGPVIAGDLQQGDVNGPNQGPVRLSQYVNLTQNSTTAVSSTLYIPAGSIIESIAAQLAAMSGQSVLGVAAPTTAPVVVTITPVGATTAGYVHVTINYFQQ